MRKLTTCILLTVFIAVGFGCINNNLIADASAQSEIAMELTTGNILIEKNADMKLPMASTTKILTAIIIIEDCNLEDVVTVPTEAAGVEGSSIYLKAGEQISVKDLLYGLMLRSGNDSAATLAIYHSGSIENFAQIMNERAKAYGAVNSNFKNPSGLPDNEHYTTAGDLCRIACHAMKNETFRTIVSTKNYTGKYKSFSNKNKMLYNYEGANGIKTGYTVKAGRCLVSSAERNGMDIVCVVLNCPDMYERSSEIFDLCFKNYKLLKLNENNIFICDNVLCKLSNSEFILINCDKNIEYSVERLQSDDSGAFAELKIFCENNLIFTGKLYSIY